MKTNPIMAILIGVLGLSAVVSVLLALTFVFKARELRSLQGQIATVNNVVNNRRMLGELANELVEYSKRNPAIDPLLQSIGAKPGKTNAAPATATKPATK